MLLEVAAFLGILAFQLHHMKKSLDNKLVLWLMAFLSLFKWKTQFSTLSPKVSSLRLLVCLSPHLPLPSLVWVAGVCIVVCARESFTTRCAALSTCKTKTFSRRLPLPTKNPRLTYPHQVKIPAHRSQTARLALPWWSKSSWPQTDNVLAFQ